jgi:hypothetical protein
MLPGVSNNGRCTDDEQPPDGVTGLGWIESGLPVMDR